MVAIKERSTSIAPQVDFDRLADVLYISAGPPVPDEGEDRPSGIVLRYGMDTSAPTGVTVIGFQHN
ncbi:MAG TPA: hypothetical protein VIJ52_06270, partial [Pseudolabrys sp.]